MNRYLQRKYTKNLFIHARENKRAKILENMT